MSEKFEHESSSPSELVGSPESSEAAKQTEKLLAEKETEPTETQEIQAVKRIIGIARAESAAEDAIENAELDKLLDSIDFDSTDRLQFSIASTGHHNTVSETVGSGSSARFLGADGKLYDRSHGSTGDRMALRYHDGQHGGRAGKWGYPSEQAFNTGKVVEQVGISYYNPDNTHWGYDEVRVPRKGLAGKLGLKRKELVKREKPSDVEPFYQFDYELATPGSATEAMINQSKDAEVGNFAGQNIKLSIKLSKEQAESLSKALAEDPTVARKLLDKFIASHGDNGKWNSELFDEEGGFHNPVKRYGEDFSARDVRPHYESLPDLKPTVIGLPDFGDKQPKRYIAGNKPQPPTGLTRAA